LPVALLGQCMALARLLQPTILVIEDADLTARMREQMDDAREEVLLNKLLNEMDGLREDADILFVLTTNRPEQLETALASRPVGSIRRSRFLCLTKSAASGWSGFTARSSLCRSRSCARRCGGPRASAPPSSRS